VAVAGECDAVRLPPGSQGDALAHAGRRRSPAAADDQTAIVGRDRAHEHLAHAAGTADDAHLERGRLCVGGPGLRARASRHDDPPLDCRCPADTGLLASCPGYRNKVETTVGILAATGQSFRSSKKSRTLAKKPSEAGLCLPFPAPSNSRSSSCWRLVRLTGVSTWIST